MFVCIAVSAEVKIWPLFLCIKRVTEDAAGIEFDLRRICKVRESLMDSFGEKVKVACLLGDTNTAYLNVNHKSYLWQTDERKEE